MLDFLFTQILADLNIYTDVEYITQVSMLGIVYAEKKFRVGKRSDFSDPFFPQKGQKTQKLGLVVVHARAEKSSEGTLQKHPT